MKLNKARPISYGRAFFSIDGVGYMENNINDKELRDNKKIEEAIELLQREMTDENLAKVLTLIRQRSKESGHFVVAVDASIGNTMSMHVLTSPDKKNWFCAYTSYEEQFKGQGKQKVMSGFTAEIKQILEMALNSSEIDGLVINPWGRVLMLNKELIRLILG